MATKTNTLTPMPTAPTPMALLEFGGTSIVLPADAATQAFALLCQGEVVEYDWSNSTHKYAKDSHTRAPTLKTFSLTQQAALALSRE
jgi:hypothetical protein